MSYDQLGLQVDTASNPECIPDSTDHEFHNRENGYSKEPQWQEKPFFPPVRLQTLSDTTMYSWQNPAMSQRWNLPMSYSQREESIRAFPVECTETTYPLSSGYKTATHYDAPVMFPTQRSHAGLSEVLWDNIPTRQNFTGHCGRNNFPLFDASLNVPDGEMYDAKPFYSFSRDIMYHPLHLYQNGFEQNGKATSDTGDNTLGVKHDVSNSSSISCQNSNVRVNRYFPYCIERQKTPGCPKQENGFHADCRFNACSSHERSNYVDKSFKDKDFPILPASMGAKYGIESYPTNFSDFKEDYEILDNSHTTRSIDPSMPDDCKMETYSGCGLDHTTPSHKIAIPKLKRSSLGQIDAILREIVSTNSWFLLQILPSLKLTLKVVYNKTVTIYFLSKLDLKQGIG